jgi:hypothetical protein
MIGAVDHTRRVFIIKMAQEEKMSQRTITLVLPETLADEAEASGLLKPQAIEALLREELRRRRIARLFQAADQLAILAMPPLTGAEVEAEIQAARKARLASDESSS